MMLFNNYYNLIDKLEQAINNNDYKTVRKIEKTLSRYNILFAKR
jgi:hypothetical protein